MKGAIFWTWRDWSMTCNMSIRDPIAISQCCFFFNLKLNSLKVGGGQKCDFCFFLSWWGFTPLPPSWKKHCEIVTRSLTLWGVKQDRHGRTLQNNDGFWKDTVSCKIREFCLEEVWVYKGQKNNNIFTHFKTDVVFPVVLGTWNLFCLLMEQTAGTFCLVISETLRCF